MSLLCLLSSYKTVNQYHTHCFPWGYKKAQVLPTEDNMARKNRARKSDEGERKSRMKLHLSKIWPRMLPPHPWQFSLPTVFTIGQNAICIYISFFIRSWPPNIKNLAKMCQTIWNRRPDSTSFPLTSHGGFLVYSHVYRQWVMFRVALNTCREELILKLYTSVFRPQALALLVQDLCLHGKVCIKQCLPHFHF